MATIDDNDLHQAVRELVAKLVGYFSIQLYNPDTGAWAENATTELINRITTFVTEQVAAERERAAGVADAKVAEFKAKGKQFDGAMERWELRADGATQVAAAIRKGDNP